jgi:hypothetical protein
MPRATNMVRFLKFPLGEELLTLECYYYFGSNNTDDPTVFEIRAAYKADGSETEIKEQLKDQELYDAIFDAFVEEFDSEVDWQNAYDPPEEF